jgi:2-phosphoglycolate phosphatase
LTNIENLIFDLDGTLIDSSHGVVEAVNYSLRQMGQPEQKPEVIKTFIGYSLEEMYPHFTDAPLKELYAHFRVKAAETVVASTEILPGVAQTLRRLDDRGFRMAIATTKIRANVNGILEKLGWQKLFHATTAGNEVEKVKPDPSILRLTLKRLKAEPSETIVVGDTINDILAAKGVPMKVVAVASPFGGQEKVIAANPDFFIESITELLDLLDRHND